jgi:hypothetical protein
MTEQAEACEVCWQSDDHYVRGHNGLLLIDLMQQRTTFNAGAYCMTPEWLRPAIEQNALGCLQKVFCFRMIMVDHTMPM